MRHTSDTAKNKRTGRFFSSGWSDEIADVVQGTGKHGGQEARCNRGLWNMIYLQGRLSHLCPPLSSIHRDKLHLHLFLATRYTRVSTGITGIWRIAVVVLAFLQLALADNLFAGCYSTVPGGLSPPNGIIRANSDACSVRGPDALPVIIN